MNISFVHDLTMHFPFYIYFIFSNTHILLPLLFSLLFPVGTIGTNDRSKLKQLKKLPLGCRYLRF